MYMTPSGLLSYLIPKQELWESELCWISCEHRRATTSVSGIYVKGFLEQVCGHFFHFGITGADIKIRDYIFLSLSVMGEFLLWDLSLIFNR